MQRLIKGFFQGSLIVIPILLTGGILWFVVKAVDGLLRAPIPGLGLMIVIVFVTAVGLLAGNVVGRRFFNKLEDGNWIDVGTRIFDPEKVYGK